MVLQAGTAAYIAHLLASSLMSRWLQHYSPVAVILRLCSMSILLSYATMMCFHLTGATHTGMDALSRSLPIWIIISITLLVVYFSTQQDISVEHDHDDKERRLVLRLKCLYAMAVSSLGSLLVIILLVQYSTMDWEQVSLRVVTEKLAFLSRSLGGRAGFAPCVEL